MAHMYFRELCSDCRGPFRDHTGVVSISSHAPLMRLFETRCCVDLHVDLPLESFWTARLQPGSAIRTPFEKPFLVVQPRKSMLFF